MKKIIGILFLIFIIVANFAIVVNATEVSEIETTSIEGENVNLIQPRDGEYEAESGDVEIIQIQEDAVQEKKDDVKTELIQDDLYKIEEDVTINQIVDGNVYVMGTNVTISNATIYGNLYVIAQKVEIINSDIGGSVYAMAETINFAGMANDIYVISSNLDFGSNSYVWRSVRTLAGTINLNGNIGRNVYASAEKIVVNDNTIINGTLGYLSENEAEVSPIATINDVQFEQKVSVDENTKENNSVNYGYVFASTALKTLIVALLVVFFVSKFKTIKRTESMTKDLLKVTGKGLAVLVLVPIISLMLLVSFIGAGLSIIVVLIYVIMIYIATSIVALDIIYRILNKKADGEIKKSKWIGFSILVALSITLIGLIPVVGGLIKFILILMGLGILFDLMFQRSKDME